MFSRIFSKYLKRKVIVKYENPIVAYAATMKVKKAFGLVVFEFKLKPNGNIMSELSYGGLISFLFWHGLFLYCVYYAYVKDQTILRKFFDTKLKQYGDEYERIASVIYVLFCMWKLAFSLYWNTNNLKSSIAIDEAVRSLDIVVDYGKDGIVALASALSQVVAYFAHTLCIGITLHNLNMDIPYERIYQVVFFDTLALILTGHYCYYVNILRKRYMMLNKALYEIKSQHAWEYTVFIRDKPRVEKATVLQDKYVCQKIRTCAKIHSMLYKLSAQVIRKFGVGLVLTTSMVMNHVVLYLFYFMEATASGLFNDVQRYVYFLFYVFWQAAYSIGILFMSVYFSELTVSEANKAICITHEIINSNLSPAVTAEAMQLSMQFLHQKPTFSPCGLYKLDYEFLSQAARSVVTFLVILLQFVMES